MANQNLPQIILRVKQLAARLSISKSSIYDRINPHSPRYDSTFPKKITLSPGVVGFLQHDVDAWVQSRINASCIKSAVGGSQNES
ncbi:helix-turn-helix transcriptional regulator [Undibacterium sp.]|uniref:helix-turn-helix transcriptional regulator n=1 Tax=Undibacterium sp. TaxID=1914977 RepID=UPI00345B9CEF